MIDGPDAAEPEVSYRCERCGIESFERTCFVIPGPYARAPRDTRCITCEQVRLRPTAGKNWQALVLSAALPFMFYFSLVRSTDGLTLGVLVLVLLMQPVLTLLHEFGHAIFGWLVRMEIARIEFGYGERLWMGTRGDTQFLLRRWPLSGRTCLGAKSVHRLRLRLWVTIAGGPLVNVILIWAAVHWWDGLQRQFGTPILVFWILQNAMILGTTLLPRRYVSNGKLQPSDGLSLLEIPKYQDAQLAVYLSSGSITRALGLLEGRDFAGTSIQCRSGLARTPGNPGLQMMLSGTAIWLGSYEEGTHFAQEALATDNDTAPILRACLEGNVAFGCLIMEPHSDASSEGLVRAEALAGAAFRSFPCLLSIRSTRALVLGAVGRVEEALRLLDYVHYRSASPIEQASYETTRAFLLRSEGKLEEAQAAARRAFELEPQVAVFLTTLGLNGSNAGGAAVAACASTSGFDA